jgi:hypothetical protein
MRTLALTLALGAVAAAPLAARADSGVPAASEIQLMVAMNVGALASGGADSQLGLVDEFAPVLVPRGVEVSAVTGEGSIADSYHPGHAENIKHSLGRPTINVDEASGLGYFQIPFDVTYTAGKAGKRREHHRIGGIATKTNTGWRFAALMYSQRLEADSALIAAAERAAKARPKSKAKTSKTPAPPAPPPAPELAGDTQLAGIVAGWFQTGFAAAAATSGTRILASGSSPRELGIDADALALARGWDKIGLRPQSIAVTMIGKRAAFAQVRCVWLAKKGKVEVPLALGIVMLPDGDSWRWVSLQYSGI